MGKGLEVVEGTEYINGAKDGKHLAVTELHNRARQTQANTRTGFPGSIEGNENLLQRFGFGILSCGNTTSTTLFSEETIY